MLRKKNQKGFTLIELLMVIAIIGILASIVLVNVNGARDRAKIARAKSEMAQFTKFANMAKISTGKTMIQITGSGCSECGECRTAADLRNTSGTCYTKWVNVLTTVGNAAGDPNAASALARDPWGSPFAMDENEMEGGSCAGKDRLRSVGPDGTFGTSDDVGDFWLDMVVCP